MVEPPFLRALVRGVPDTYAEAITRDRQPLAVDVGTARRHNVDPLQLATALLARAQGHPAATGSETLSAVIDDAWGELFRSARMPLPHTG